MKRIAVGFLLGFILLGAGTTYAFSDAGAAIYTWFQQSLLEQSNKIENEAANHITSSFEEILTDFQKASQDAEDQLIGYQVELTTDYQKTIEAHHDQYIQQLQTTTENLKQQSQHDMQLYKEQTKSRAEAQASQDVEAILAELLVEQNGSTENMKND
ncbi:hypothetical protein [Neobacillus dielmonensis]|uniref:hypothetical protein n=1 Tax=Neobacillus dielmonensis TaxID=1347369 RepID=UPI0005AA00AE|nr:hypothetical protein [Neobacillus dielmonensis]